MTEDRRLPLPIKLLPGTIAKIDQQADRLIVSRWKAIEMMVEHGIPWLESLPNALGDPDRD